MSRTAVAVAVATAVSTAVLGAPLFPASAAASDASPAADTGENPFSHSGRIFSNFYWPGVANPGSGLIQRDSEAWLTGGYRMNSETISKVTLMLRNLDRPRDAQINGENSVTTSLNLREAYIRYGHQGPSSIDLIVGQQLLPWGKADAVNPTDYFSSKDLRIFTPDEEVRRRGPVAAVLNLTPEQGASPFTFTGVFVPVFQKSEVLVPPQLVPAFVTLNAPTRPAFTASELEGALKASYAGSGWDASLSAFRGWNRLANLNLALITPRTITVAQNFNRVNALGADTSASFGSYVFRAESALKWTSNTDGRDARISPATQEIVAGFERPLGDRFRAQLQGTYRHISDYSNWRTSLLTLNPIDQAISQANSSIQGYQFRHLPGGTLRVSYVSPEESWKSELFILASFPRPYSQYFIRPKLTYEWFSGFETTAGLDHYVGSAGTLVRASQDYRSVFLEARYVF